MGLMHKIAFKAQGLVAAMMVFVGGAALAQDASSPKRVLAQPRSTDTSGERHASSPLQGAGPLRGARPLEVADLGPLAGTGPLQGAGPLQGSGPLLGAAPLLGDGPLLGVGPLQGSAPLIAGDALTEVPPSLIEPQVAPPAQPTIVLVSLPTAQLSPAPVEVVAFPMVMVPAAPSQAISTPTSTPSSAADPVVDPVVAPTPPIDSPPLIVPPVRHSLPCSSVSCT